MKALALALALAGAAGAQSLPRPIDAAALRQLLHKSAGRPVLINVFASWCAPCRAELGDLASLKKKHPKLVLIGIDIDKDDAALRSFLPSVPPELQLFRSRDGAGPLLPALRLPKDWNEAMPPGWEEQIPLSFLFDKRGRFANGSVGQLSAEALAAFGEGVR